MKRSGKLIVLLTVAGLLGAAAAVDASGLVKKVTGHLRKDVKVVADGKNTGMEPVFINGKAYLPAREAAAAFGYELSWSEKGKAIFLHDKSSILHNNGVIETATSSNGEVTFDFLGKSLNGNGGRIVFKANAQSVIQDTEGKAVPQSNLKAGMRVSVEYGPAVLTGNPLQAYARKVVVEQQRLIREDVIREVTVNGSDARIVFGITSGASYTPDLVLNLGKETSVVTPDGKSAPWSVLEPGMIVRAYYGPALMKSMPPQSPADTIVAVAVESKYQISP